MSNRKRDPLESLLGRVDELDSISRANLIARLARERRMLSKVFTALREGVLVIQHNGTIEYANTSACELLGLSEQDLLNTLLWRAMPELTRTLNVSPSGILADADNLSRELELAYPQRRIVRIYLVPFDALDVLDQHGTVRFAVIISDITRDKKQTRREIEDERVKSVIDLAAGVAHELGNPLNSLNIHLQVLRRTIRKAAPVPDAHKLERSIDICAAEVERLDGIITHFLEAIRPQPPDFSELDIIKPLEESLEFLRPELEGAGLNIDVSIAHNIPPILGDRNQIKQVFFNVIKNAREAMPSGGQIRIKASADDDFVFVRIGDTGKGIPQEALRKVFQPYFTTRKGGSGLGMMIVERILRDHGGKVGLDSRQGVGTLVTLQFPQIHRTTRLLPTPERP